ncbi:F0F1 ATP synthase subunit B [Candidatus Nomurabacteria bacterium]|nr:F0F1 ATP synthase subunit B [Candidatus Nomurabacteria bacterium]
MNIIDILGTIGFDWQVASVNLVSFLIIYWILKKFVFDHVKKLIKERRETIAAGLNNAEEAQTALARAQEEATGITHHAQQEAHTLIASAKERAEGVADKVVHDAQQQAQSIVADAHTRGEADIADMRQALKSEMADMVIATVAKITHENMSAEKQQSLMNRAADLIAQS